MAKSKKNKRKPKRKPGPNKKTPGNIVPEKMRQTVAASIPYDATPKKQSIKDAAMEVITKPGNQWLGRRVFETNNTRPRLVSQYNAALAKKGFIKTKEQILSGNIIDARGICYMPGKPEAAPYVMPSIKPIPAEYDEQFAEYISADTICPLIPCFQSGTLQMANYGFTHWEIIQISPNLDWMIIDLENYGGNHDDTRWEPAASAQIKISVRKEQPDTVAKLSIEMMSERNYSDVYRMIPPSEMPWDKKEINIWNNTVIPFADETLKHMYETGKPPYKSIGLYFVIVMRTINFYLGLHKPKAIRTKANKDPDAPVRQIQVEPDAAPKKRLVRTVGTALKITSEKPPKQPTPATVIKYKTPVWTARGGVRRLKSGKLVPFKESVRHRKCLQDKTQNQNIPASTLIIRDNFKKKDGG